MKTYTQFDAPAKIYGAPLFASTGTLDRLPPELRARLGPDGSIGISALEAMLTLFRWVIV